MSKSVAKERQINCYPPPYLKAKLESYARDKVISKSEAVNEALRKMLCEKTTFRVNKNTY